MFEKKYYHFYYWQGNAMKEPIIHINMQFGYISLNICDDIHRKYTKLYIHMHNHLHVNLTGLPHVSNMKYCGFMAYTDAVLGLFGGVRICWWLAELLEVALMHDWFNPVSQVFDQDLRIKCPCILDETCPLELPGFVCHLSSPFGQVICEVHRVSRPSAASKGLSFKFFLYFMTRALVHLLANFTMIDRGGVVGWTGGEGECSLLSSSGSGASGGSLTWGLGGGLPKWWATSMSSRTRGGETLRWEFTRRSSLSSTVPMVCSGTPKIRMEPRRPCCSRSSYLTFRLVTSLHKMVISSSLAWICFLRESTSWLLWCRASWMGASIGHTRPRSVAAVNRHSHATLGIMGNHRKLVLYHNNVDFTATRGQWAKATTV